MVKTTARNLLPYIFISIGIVFGVWAIILIVNNHQQVVEPPADTVSSVQAPSAVKPTATAIDSYRVAPNLPKYITIPRANVSKAKVVQLGLLKNGQIATPDNIFNTGWYNASAKPGQNGAMFIYGHVSSWQANGVFFNLKNLKAGDQILVTRGDNTVYTYQVVSLKIYPYNNVDMNSVLAPIHAGQPGLNLMTCTGQVIKGTSEFNERLVVYASLVK